jgi:hypothetical protein
MNGMSKVDAWTGPRIVIEREDRGRHIHRGSHSSSHDSRRRYLSDAYLEKSLIFEERA